MTDVSKTKSGLAALAKAREVADKDFLSPVGQAKVQLINDKEKQAMANYHPLNHYDADPFSNAHPEMQQQRDFQDTFGYGSPEVGDLQGDARRNDIRTANDARKSAELNAAINAVIQPKPMSSGFSAMQPLMRK